MSTIRKSVISGIAFFSTVGILAVAHSAYLSTAPSATSSWSVLSSSEWNKMVTSFQTLDSKLSVLWISGTNVWIWTQTPWTSLYVQSAQSASTPHPFRAWIITQAEGTNVGWRFMAQTNSDVENPWLFTQRSRGTLANPQPVQTNDQLLFLNGHGYDWAEYTWGGQAGISFVASENWSATNHGTYMMFLTTNTWATSYTEKMRLNSAGSLWIWTTSPAAKLDVNGTLKSHGRMAFWDSGCVDQATSVNGLLLSNYTGWSDAWSMARNYGAKVVIYAYAGAGCTSYYYTVHPEVTLRDSPQYVYWNSANFPTPVVGTSFRVQMY